MASRFVPVKSFEEAEKLFEAGLLLIDDYDEAAGEKYRTSFTNLHEPEAKWARDVWRKYFGQKWPMKDYGVFVEDDTSEDTEL